MHPQKDRDMNVSCSFHGSQMEAVRTEVSSGFELPLCLSVLELKAKLPPTSRVQCGRWGCVLPNASGKVVKLVCVVPPSSWALGHCGVTLSNPTSNL
ncbi:hypothetical protein STEG23_030260 [Scotinomys teguina]